MSKNNIRERLIGLEEDGKVDIDIGYRGGNYGLSASLFISEFIPEKDYAASIINYLPNKVGVYCNYLGGGLRGSIVGGGYGDELPLKIKKIIDGFTAICKERYLEIEDGLNNEVDEDGETNWNAVGTNRNRDAGIVSAY